MSSNILFASGRHARIRSIEKLVENKIQREAKQDKLSVSQYNALARDYLKNIHEQTPIEMFMGRSRVFDNSERVDDLLKQTNKDKQDFKYYYQDILYSGAI